MEETTSGPGVAKDDFSCGVCATLPVGIVKINGSEYKNTTRQRGPFWYSLSGKFLFVLSVRRSKALKRGNKHLGGEFFEEFCADHCRHVVDVPGGIVFNDVGPDDSSGNPLN